MINWYIKYDQISVDKEFFQINYKYYNPNVSENAFHEHYFNEIVQNFRTKVESGDEPIPLSNHLFCSKCQKHLLSQNTVLHSIFKTEAILTESKPLNDFAEKATDYLESERFYFYSFWNSFPYDKDFLIVRLNNSFNRFLKFLISLNSILLSICRPQSQSNISNHPSSSKHSLKSREDGFLFGDKKEDSDIDMETYEDMQSYLRKSYNMLITEISQYEYLYTKQFLLIRTIYEICSKLTDDIQCILSNYEDTLANLQKTEHEISIHNSSQNISNQQHPHLDLTSSQPMTDNEHEAKYLKLDSRTHRNDTFTFNPNESSFSRTLFREDEDDTKQSEQEQEDNEEAFIKKKSEEETVEMLNTRGDFQNNLEPYSPSSELPKNIDDEFSLKNFDIGGVMKYIRGLYYDDYQEKALKSEKKNNRQRNKEMKKLKQIFNTNITHTQNDLNHYRNIEKKFQISNVDPNMASLKAQQIMRRQAKIELTKKLLFRGLTHKFPDPNDLNNSIEENKNNSGLFQSKIFTKQNLKSQKIQSINSKKRKDKKQESIHHAEDPEKDSKSTHKKNYLLPSTKKSFRQMEKEKIPKKDKNVKFKELTTIKDSEPKTPRNAKQKKEREIELDNISKPKERLSTNSIISDGWTSRKPNDLNDNFTNKCLGILDKSNETESDLRTETEVSDGILFTKGDSDTSQTSYSSKKEKKKIVGISSIDYFKSSRKEETPVIFNQNKNKESAWFGKKKESEKAFEQTLQRKSTRKDDLEFNKKKEFDDWALKITFKELNRQNRFEVVNHKNTVLFHKNKKPNKYRDICSENKFQ